ncbi:hypothetical protein AMATHDRAFT_142347 [Amanita thiersii Skay4041]|uniref:Zn(2)-C6 fungal-type domain-containing protein n=1 Tax=Amanita thiersii Skay4041 TaxID=703135 RepID=A0A2A9NKM3_9AGAR|nr:hypothetical protein AMATHDRAFT_142347 [Amanita thiersii Skay4041]
MSSESSTQRKKRSSSNPIPAPEGDHRKRRRNRTTQSCLNCHTSKRMCDRKRPACARCTQLGLTGLCVYEVDDPNQRSDSQDEIARLLKRVAELEGVIRELKKKPHPRWVQNQATSSYDVDKQHLSDQAGHASPGSSKSPLMMMPDKANDNNIASFKANFFSSSMQLLQDDLNQHRSNAYSPYQSPSPQSIPSPSLATPAEDHLESQVSIVGQPGLSPEYDLASILMAYPGLMGYDETTFGASDELPIRDEVACKHVDGHCGCLHESANYQAILELSVRLRKGANVLAHSANHRFGVACHLKEKITELDSLVSTALGNISSPLEDDSGLALDTTVRVPSQSTYPFSSVSGKPTSVPAISSQTLQGLRSWDLIQSVSNSPASDDTFMSWEPLKRP